MTLRRSRLTAAALGGFVAMLFSTSPVSADSFRDRQWHLGALDVAAAHEISQGEGVTVAVIDSGVKANHPDLTGNVLAGIDLTGADTKGWEDSDGHGTGMAGLIAGHGHGPRNTAGALGIAPRSRILPVRFKVTEQTNIGEGNRADELAMAIVQATERDVDIISISQVTTSTPRLEGALQSALDNNVVVVAGVGNRPKDVFIQYPARYPGVVAVGASGRNGKVAPVSATGREMVINAPGVDIVSTDGVGGYRIATGTSDATAIVAGAAALIRSKYPKLSASEVVHRLTSTATDKGKPGRDDQYGFGSLNLVAALTAKVPPATATASPTPAPSESTTAPVAAGESVSLKPNAAFFVAVGVLLLSLLAGVGAVVWFVRSRRRQVSPTRSTAPR